MGQNRSPFSSPATLDEELRAFEAEAPEGAEYIRGYWFAWSAFHPDTTVFTPAGDR